MSATNEPITSARFSAALSELPVSSLFAKKSEILNSVAHLELSNNELRNYADAGDEDCAGAIEENVDVIARMHTRLELLKAEVENRGLGWDETKTERSNGQSVGDESSVGGGVQEQSIGNSAQSGHHRTVQQPLTAVSEDVEHSLDRRNGRRGRLEEDGSTPLIARQVQQQDTNDPTNGIHL